MMRDTFHLRALFLFVCVGCIASRAAAEEAVQVRWVNQGGVRVEVSGIEAGILKTLDEAGQKALLKVFVAEPGPLSDDAPAMAGTYRVDGGAVVCEPQCPPQAGVTYRAVARSGGAATVADFTPAVAAAKPNTLTQIYPTPDRVPE